MLIKNLTNKETFLRSNSQSFFWYFNPCEIRKIKGEFINRPHLDIRIVNSVLEIIPEKEISRFELIDL